MTNEKRISSLIAGSDIELIDRAAKYERRTRTNFVLSSAVEKARQVLQEELVKREAEAGTIEI